jgi:glycosyltransferase involved in cell wall biosynthesis
LADDGQTFKGGKDKMKLMILSNSPDAKSGFSVVAANLAQELSKLNNQIAITGMQTVTSPWMYRDIPIYPIVGDYNEAVHPQLLLRGLKNNIRMHGSEALLCIFPPDMKHDMFTQVHPNTIWYMVLDEELVYRDHPILKAARKVKKLVAMTHSAGKQLEKQGVSHSVIYPGHDPAIFHKGFDKTNQEPVAFYAPSNNSEFTIAAGQIPELWEKLGIEFLVGFAGQNNGLRKRIELLIEAFSIFAKDKGLDVHLHLHTLPDYVTGIQLIELAHYFGITDRITFSYGSWRSSGGSEDTLNILYNTFDIFATASSGGGFELTNFETAAIGIPQVCPDVMPFNELYLDGERGLLAGGRRQFIQSGAFRFLVDPQQLADKMQIMYENRQLRDKLGRNCAAWAKEYTWTKTALQFDEIFKNISATHQEK